MEKRIKITLSNLLAAALLMVPLISLSRGGHGGHRGGHRGGRGRGRGHTGRGHRGHHQGRRRGYGRHGYGRRGYYGRNWSGAGWGWWGYNAAFWGAAALTTAAWLTWPRERFYQYYDNSQPVLNRSRQAVVIYSGGTPDIELAPGEKAYMPSGQKMIIERDGRKTTTENLSGEYYID